MMRTNRALLRAGLGGALLVAALAIAWAQTGPATLPAQTSSARGVTIQVTPKPARSGHGRWEFAVVLDTHSAELNDDLMQSAVLATDDGRTFRPVGWRGAAPGGHHRKGALAFDIPAPPPAALELRIVRPGESAPRTFRWKL